MSPLPKKAASWKLPFAWQELVLVAVVIGELLYFNSAGRNFLTADNVGNIIRHSTEIGLLALVMMPIILTAIGGERTRRLHLGHAEF